MEIDWSKFKKTSEDKKSAVLKHEDGHEFTIAKHVLSPKLRNEIKKLPMAMKDGGLPAEGSDSEEKAPLNLDAGSYDADKAKYDLLSNSTLGDQAKEEVAQKSGLNLTPDQINQAIPQGNQHQAPNIIINNTPPPTPQPQQALTPVVPPAANQAPQGAAPKMPPIADIDPFTAAQQGVQMQGAGIAAEAQAAGQMGREQSGIYSEAAKKQQQIVNDFNEKAAPMVKAYQDLQADMAKGHFDADNYVNNMSGGQKIRSAIGLILGGMGAGLTHGPNMALQFLQQQINNDIESQRQEFGKKKSLFEANRQQFSDLKDTTAVTLAQTNAIVANQIAAAAAKSQDPMAKARATQAIGQLYRNSTGVIQDNAMKKLLYQGMQSSAAPSAGQPSASQTQTGPSPDQTAKLIDYMRVAKPEMAKEYEERFVPGVGLGQVKIPEKVRDEVIARQNLNDAVIDLRNFAQQNEGKLKLLDPAIVNEGQTKAKLVQDAYRSASGQGVFREAEKNFVEGIVDQDPTKFLNALRVDPKYKALENDNMNRLNGIKKGYGLPAPYRPKSAQDYKGQ